MGRGTDPDREIAVVRHGRVERSAERPIKDGIETVIESRIENRHRGGGGRKVLMSCGEDHAELQVIGDFGGVTGSRSRSAGGRIESRTLTEQFEGFPATNN